MTVKGGTCAACKYQRRKCSADCPLAPYFPPDQPKLFENAHRLFGVSNIIKILNKIEPSQKTDAMRSIIYEANVRDCYPAHGCVGLINGLLSQIQHAQMELDAVNAQLAIYRPRSHFVSSSSSSSSDKSHVADKHLPFDDPSTVMADNSDNNKDLPLDVPSTDTSDNNKKIEASWIHNSDHNSSNDDKKIEGHQAQEKCFGAATCGKSLAQ